MVDLAAKTGIAGGLVQLFTTVTDPTASAQDKILALSPYPANTGS
jgi:hypothetical protein